MGFEFYKFIHYVVFWCTCVRTILIVTWTFTLFYGCSNLMNLWDLWEKLLPQILQMCKSSFLWTKSTGFLGSHFLWKNFNSKLDTWMFLNPIKLSLCGDWFTFFENSSWCSLGFYSLVWLIQSHELFQHVFLKHIY